MADEIIRKVVGREEKPYDTDRDNNILYVKFDVLECGHKIRAFNYGPIKQSQHADLLPAPPRERRCRKCENEVAETVEEEQQDG